MFPKWWTHETLTERALAEILVNQHKILQAQEDFMSAFATLQADLNQLQTDLAAFVAAPFGGATEAQLQALDAQVKAMDATITAPAAPTAAPKA